MPAQTGLSQLGDALLRGTGDYANIQLRKRQEDERRVQQLADLQNNRLYSEGQFDKARGLALGDEGRHRQQALDDEGRRRQQKVDDETYQILLKEGWLKPVDAGIPTAIAAAAENRQKYIDKERSLEEKALGDAQAELNSLAKDRMKLGEKDAALDTKLQSLEQDFQKASEQAEYISPTQEQIDDAAIKLAIKAGVKLSDTQPERGKQLERHLETAKETLTTKAFLAAQAADKKSKAASAQYTAAAREKTSTSNQLQTVRQTMADIMRQFPGKLAPVRGMPKETIDAGTSPIPPSVNEESGVSSPAQATLEQKRAAYIGGGPPSTPQASPPSLAPSSTQTLQVPTVAPAPQPMTGTPAPPAVSPAAALASPARAATSEPYQFKGGLFGLMERGFGQPEVNPADSPSFITTASAAGRNLAKLPTLADRGVGTLATLALTGEGSMADRGGLETLGNAWADSALSAEQIADESTLRNAPNSFRAQEIRRIRSKLAPLTPRSQRTLGQVFTDPRTQR